jgi:predicted amidohydrolase
MPATLHLSLVQASLHWEDADANLKMFEERILPLAGKTDVIVLPEMFTSGFTMNAAAVAEPMDGPSMQWMRRISEHTGAAVTGSLVIESAGMHYNRLIWMFPDGTYRHYDKKHLFGLAGEENNYAAGTRRNIIEWKGWRIFPLICYDLRFPVWSRHGNGFEYDLLLYVANWPERRNSAWKKLLPARAIENQCYVAAVNRVGADGNGVPHTGDSVVIDFTGETIQSGAAGAECVLQALADLDSLNDFRKQLPFLKDADNFSFQ